MTTDGWTPLEGEPPTEPAGGRRRTRSPSAVDEADPEDRAVREQCAVAVDAALDRLRIVLGMVVVTVAAVVLVVGWFGGVDIVTRLHPSLVSMKANTAVGFLCIGGVLLSVESPRARWSIALAAGAALLGGATAFEYASGLDLGIDELLVDDPDATRTASPGRMGLNTAIGFALVGLGRLAGTRTRLRNLEVALVGVTAVLSFLAFTGYLYSVSSTRGLGSATEMALHTSLLFLCYGAGITDVLSRHGVLGVLRSPFIGGRMYRIVLPTVIAVVVAVAVSVQQLETVGVLDDPELVLAFTTAITLALVLAAALGVALLLDRSDRAATAARAEVERQQAEFTAELRALNRSLEGRVTDRTNELAEANVDLARSNRDLEQFAYVASHDLREPLRMVSSFVHKLSDRYGDELDDRGRQYLGFALEGADRMSTMLDSLLALSRAGRSDVHRVPVDVPGLVDSLRPMLPDDATVTVDASMPTVRTDEDLLSQVLQNLLSNAGKFVRPGQPPRIEISGTRPDGRVRLHVDDAGPGIAPEHREKIFLLFHRLPSRSTAPGTGIGLTLVERIVHRLGGTIDVGDSPIGGTRFTVTLPDTPEVDAS